ncbi:hypothetical protein O9X90_06645 [Agrobacterium leguminum]|uniref:hypothetical protein n=1 Tax=Agrobacterium leguminum TaxID=2792015 RepID=UPI0022B85745|nr:hypothetical protein [Agrobacterium leguminum]MCZ7931984.1 hypothetical protein [Agrobacterium leguminum]
MQYRPRLLRWFYLNIDHDENTAIEAAVIVLIHLAEKSAIVTLSCCCFNKSQFEKADAVLPQAWHG